MNESPHTRWFPPLHPERPDATVRLYCLPFSGGSAEAYRPWAEELPPWVQLRAVQLPGRRARAGEPALTSVGQVVSAVADAMELEPTELPYGLFGHSMGALLAFELARELRRRDVPQPLLVGVAGWPAPDTGLPHVPITGPLTPLTDEQFIEVMGGMGAISRQALADPEELERTVRPMRTDFALIEAYTYREGPALASPLGVFSGSEDPLTPLEKLHGWAQQTTGAVRVRRYDGGHFFLFDHVPAMVKAYTEDLERLARHEEESAG